MKNQFSGQCQCGYIKYCVTGTPLAVFACHCTECQRQSSSAFGMALWIKKGKIEIINGKLKKWTRLTPSGNQMECSFCPNCGSRLFHQILNQSEIFSIKPGTLDDTSWLKPSGHIWTEKSQSWCSFEGESLTYEQNPDSFSEIINKWTEGKREELREKRYKKNTVILVFFLPSLLSALFSIFFSSS